MKKCLRVATCLTVMGIAGSANAYVYDLGANSTVTGDAFTDPGLVMQVEINPLLDSLIYDLGVGDSATFLFATFWTDETWVNSDDKVPQSLTATVDFDSPEIAAAVNGNSVGTTALWGFIQGWEITWDGSEYVPFGDGGAFTLELSDASFYSVLGPDGRLDLCGCTIGCNYTANVYATITHHINPNPQDQPIPEPTTMLLFGAGIAGLAGINRRRKK